VLFDLLASAAAYIGLAMYLTDFEEFMAASVKLFQSNPSKTRYSMKFRGENKVVVLKVTDDKVVIKHKIKVQRDLKKLDQWNTTFVRLAAGH
jgi:signal recognition particle subunit SRP9